MRRLHPAYVVIERTERLWTDDPKQAAERASVIMERLAAAGILPMYLPEGSGPTKVEATVSHGDVVKYPDDRYVSPDSNRLKSGGYQPRSGTTGSGVKEPGWMDHDSPTRGKF